MEFFLALLALGYFAIFIARYSSYPVDDGFIHLRIARNIAEHGRPYFNLEERVMGSAPHLWINLLALLLLVNRGSAAFLPFLAFFLTAVTFFLCAALLRERFSRAWSLVLACLVLALFELGPTAGLMEVPLVTALCFLSLFYYSRNELGRAAFVGSLGIWARPELALLAGFSFVFAGTLAARARYFAGLFPGIAAYVAYDLFYFGTVVPFPMVAKPYVYPVSLVHDLNYGAISEADGPWIYKLFGGTERSSLWCGGLTAICLALFFAWLIRAALARRDQRWLAVAVLSSAATLAAHLVHGALLFSWYLPMILVPLAISALLLVPARRRKLGAVAVAAFLGFLPYFQVGLLDLFAFATGQDQYEEEFAPGWRVRQFLKVGQELNEIDPNSTVLAPEIGALGWAHPGRIIDSCALVTPAALKYYLPRRDIDMRVPPAMVKEFHPDYLVSLGLWMSNVREAIADGSLQGYREIRRIAVIPPEIARKTGVRKVWQSGHVGVVGRIVP